MIGDLFRNFLAHLGVLRKSEPIDSVDSFGDFLATRAALVGQKKLYEYVKQRMGTSYPRMFEDAPFIESLNIAKWHVYAACLSDLAIWMAAQLQPSGATPTETAALAKRCFDDAVTTRFERKEFTGDINELIDEFEKRAALTDWHVMAEGENAFTLSPKQLVRWAPIANDLKKYDVEIVRNSLRFAWLSVRQQLRDNLRADAVLADWRGIAAGGQ
jgi:hypothetical protein